VRDLRNVVQRISTLHGDAPLDAHALRPLLDPRAAPIEGPTGEPAADEHELAVRRAVDALLAIKGRPADNLKLMMAETVLRLFATCRSDRAVAKMTGVHRAKVREIRNSLAGKR
jgi:hypothetical protein